MPGTEQTKEPKLIGFYTGGQPFEGDGLERGGGLGGSETAFIQITSALARRGHRVMAFNGCRNPGVYNGVTYHNFTDSLPVLAKEHFDVFVVSRHSAFFNLPFSAGLKVLWNHDTLDNPRELRMVHDEIDLFLVLSEFHKDNFLIRLPLLDDRLVITRNGLDFALIDQAALGCPDPKKLIYASRPERGLKTLLEDVWPRLHRWNPDLTLYVCGYKIQLQDMPPQLEELYRHIDMLLESTPGLEILGSLGKSEYYRHLGESALMVYPSVFPEVSCIAALEAQALGVPVLTSDSFALSETVVSPQTKISGKPGSPEYVNDYVERAMFLLSNRQELSRIAKESREAVRHRYSWAMIAAEWERLFSLSLKAKNIQSFFLETGIESSDKPH